MTRCSCALGTGAWAIAVSATAAIAHLAIERLDDAAGTGTGFASYAHPLFVPIVLLAIALAGLGLWSAVARSMSGERRDIRATAFFGASIRNVSSGALTAMVFGGALAILAAAESIEQLVATGHVSLWLALGAHWPLGIAIVAFIAYALTSFGVSIARTAVGLLVAGSRALDVLARREPARIGAHMPRREARPPRSVSPPLARCRALRAPPVAA